MCNLTQRPPKSAHKQIGDSGESFRFKTCWQHAFPALCEFNETALNRFNMAVADFLHRGFLVNYKPSRPRLPYAHTASHGRWHVAAGFAAAFLSRKEKILPVLGCARPEMLKKRERSAKENFNGGWRVVPYKDAICRVALAFKAQFN